MALKEIQDKFGGTWKLARSEKFDEYLEAMGMYVEYVLRFREVSTPRSLSGIYYMT